MMNELFNSSMEFFFNRHKKYLYPFGSGIMNIKIIKSKMGGSTIKILFFFRMSLSISQNREVIQY
jgi:hypothetical protein